MKDMTIGMRTVTVKQVPEKLNIKQRWAFFREMEACMNLDRPRIVLDCSRLRSIDKTAIHLMLRCLEEAMKRNGDVKLASIPAGSKAILDLTGVSRLFEIFPTPAEAVKSFHQLPVNAALLASVPQSSHQTSQAAVSVDCDGGTECATSPA
jgi:anti-anti-sigma factor